MGEPAGHSQHWMQVGRALWRIVQDPLLATALVIAYFARPIARLVLDRLPYPYDLYIWSESPFMTNMMKLASGAPLYAAPDAANSFVYPPGLELLCRLLLRPIGRDLDVRFCRGIAVGLGVVVAVLAAFVAERMRGAPPAPEGQSKPRRSVVALVAGAMLAWIVLQQNFTADVLHPDNLHMAHAFGCLALGMTALEKRSERAAMAGAALAGLGVLTKQTESASLFGMLIIAAFALGIRSRAFLRTLAVGAGTAALAAGWLFSNRWARFQLFTVLSSQPVDTHKALEIIDRVQLAPHRVALLALACAGVGILARRGRVAMLGAWALLGVTCTLPNVAAFAKTMGDVNNLGIMEMWLFVPAWTAVADAAEGGRTGRVAATALATVLLLFLRPTKLVAPASLLAHNENIERRIAADVASGKHILVSHGAAWLIRAGVKEAPEDRENSDLELEIAQLGGRAGTLERIEAGTYDRLYVVNGWYSGAVSQAIDAHYQRDVPPPPTAFDAGYPQGFQVASRAVEVWTRK